MKTKEQTPAYAGVDISKDRLDVSLAGQGPSHYANNASGIGQLIKVLESLPEPVRVICEPSGGYERALLEGLWRRVEGVRPKHVNIPDNSRSINGSLLTSFALTSFSHRRISHFGRIPHKP
jgi:hypothetical protein